MPDLPAELWSQVFDLAADEDVIFQHGLPTSMAESAWFKDFFGEWTLRSPADALNLVQRRSYATKKAIVRTCKKWRTLGAEFLFRCLFFNDPGKLLALCALLDSSSAASTTATNSLGWWTRRIHLTRFYTPSTRGTTPEALQDALTSIIRHCANLEIFIVDWPMAKHAFVPVADALATYTKKTLRTLSISVPASALPKVIWALDALPNVFAAHIELEAPTSDVDLPDANADADETPLGAAHNIHLRLPRLAQLSLRGPHLQQFLEQATGWALPSLRHLSIDCASGRADTPTPDALSFLRVHGAPLLFLDLSTQRALPIRRILAACPALRTLAFNADWRVVDHSADDDAEEGRAPFAHDHIANVGLHGLAYAFGVGYTAAAADATSGGISIPHILATSANDRTLAALLASPPSSSSFSVSDNARFSPAPTRFFPALTRIRVLSRPLLLALNKADGPAPGEGMGRWERWWGAAAAAGIRLEDCTGGLLGVLPQDADPPLVEDSDDEGEGGEEDEAEAEEEGDWEYAEGEDADTDADPEKPGTGLRALRALLEECRAMDAGRDERYVFEDPEVRAMFPAVDVPEIRAGAGVDGGAGAGPEIRVTPPEAGAE
ncbi:hypothetical protein B0H11DRAFT_1815486 [Mycena galericulata]|nr:hypothetical protein B0H11DRAFT_1815486 [Mycena galericulata]